MATDHRALQYTAQESRITLKDGQLYRQYFGETGAVKYLQVLLPEQLVDSFIEAHHGPHDKHPGITKVIQQCREKILLPRSRSKNSQTHQSMHEMHANKADGQPSPHPTNY